MRVFTLSVKQLIFEPAILTAKLFDLGFELLLPMNGPGMHDFPTSWPAVSARRFRGAGWPSPHAE